MQVLNELIGSVRFLYEVSSDLMKKDNLFDINVCAIFNGEIHFHEPVMDK